MVLRVIIEHKSAKCVWQVQTREADAELIPTVHANGQQSALCLCGLEK